MATTLSRFSKMRIGLITLYLFINGLFILKYFARINVNVPLILSTYTVLLLIIVILINFYFDKISKRAIKIAYWTLISLIIIIITILLIKINPYTIHVDRWSAIHNFLYNLFNGLYPYSAKTHLGGYGSPFPVWQAFHIPFYLLGDVGLGMLFSIILLSIFLIWLFDNYLKAIFFIALLALSPAFWYEVAVRSDLFYNFILCLIAITFIHKKKYSIQNQVLGLGILCGLFLSTRFSIVIPFAIYLFPDFIRSDKKHKFTFGAVIILVFLISFLPFIFWNFKTLFFFEYNPFILQTRQGSLFEVVLISLLGVFLSLKWKGNISLCSSYISITLFILVTVTFLHRMISEHFVNGLFSSSYDITYFNMSFPFIIFALAGNDKAGKGND